MYKMKVGEREINKTRRKEEVHEKEADNII